MGHRAVELGHPVASDEFVLGWPEEPVSRLPLPGMDGEPTREAEPARGQRVATKDFRALEIETGRVDCQAASCGSGEIQGPTRVAQLDARLAAQDAEICSEIFTAEGDPDDTWMLTASRRCTDRCSRQRPDRAATREWRTPG